MSIDRRNFLKLVAAASAAAAAGEPIPAFATSASPRPSSRQSPDVVVIGAGAFGGWTALYLKQLGASVTLLDMYGPGNSRATSGDETRGIRSSYRRRRWVEWATEAIARWKQWDETWAEALRLNIFFTTGDLILRQDWNEEFRQITEHWDAIGVAWERLDPDEIRRRHPQINIEGMGVGLYEPQAGVARARRSCETVMETFRRMGGEFRLARAEMGRREGGRLLDVVLQDGERLSAGQFVFACGPWLMKTVPEMENRMRISMGHVFYYGTPPGDFRFTYPNLPSWNVPGVTGWPSLGPDNRGFRVRTGGRQEPDPDTSVRWIDPSYHDRPRQILAQYFPDMANAPLLETRACHYDSSSTGNFIIDRIPGLSNAWVAGAGNAEGFKMGPVSGEFAATRVLGLEHDSEVAAEFVFPPSGYEGGGAGGEEE